jgi:uncharacterized protein (DUF302 family)
VFYALKNLFALIGLIAVVIAVMIAIKMAPVIKTIDGFDEKAVDVYADIMQKVIETGNAADATVWKVPVIDGLDIADVEKNMRFAANEHNIKNVGELPLSNEVARMTGKDSRYFKIFTVCNPLTVAKMIDYSDAYSAYLPCRISLVEDKTGKLWLYTLNMDAMIYGGKPLPPALKEEAENVKTTVLDIMDRSAQGSF